jgi:hypothetical protein
MKRLQRDEKNESEKKRPENKPENIQRDDENDEKNGQEHYPEPFFRIHRSERFFTHENVPSGIYPETGE